MNIGIIVLNYNRKDLLEKCLLSLIKLEYDNYKVIVVDNGSNDGSIELIKDKFKDVHLIEMGYNSGFCKGNNAGIDYALGNGHEGLVILNNDTEVDSFFLKGIVEILDKNEKVGMISTNILLMYSPGIIDANGFMVTPDGIGKNLNAGKNKDTGISSREVFCPTGAATFYRRELLEDIKQNGQYYDEDYEFCYEELDLGWRARLRGWGCLYAPNAMVYHHKSATAGQYSTFWAYYSNRNLFFNIIKNYPSLYRVFKALILSLARYVILFAGIFLNKGVGDKIKTKIGYCTMAKVFFRSLKDAFIKIPRMIRKRRYIQSRKNVESQEINRWFDELGFSFFDSIYKL